MTVSSDRINIAWLIRLRWAVVAGQLVTVVVAKWVMGVHLPLAWLLSLIGVEAVTNIGCVVRARNEPPVTLHFLGAVMALDVLLFTGLLYFTGGPANPFSFLYLVYLAAAALLLSPAWTWALAGLSLACSAVLFLEPHELHVGHTHAEHMRIHLQGMWVALGVASAFIVYFLMRVTRALSAREQELAQARQAALRQERLASLATLAAGAAHELATPLATIATVAKELERQLGDASESARDDMRLIRGQVDRCRAILDQMSADSGEATGEALTDVTVEALLAAATVGVRPAPAVRVETDEGRQVMRVPERAVAQAIRGIIVNAQDASAADADVVVRARVDGGVLRVEVQDRGAGMAADVLARAGEPFFTTKEPGRGMGLGLFLTRAVLERVGGELVLDSKPGTGTVAQLRVPVICATNRHIGGAAAAL